MTWPSWLGRAARNRHRHAIEQASRRWRGGRRYDSARTRRKILISTQVPVEITPFCHEHTIRVVGDLPALKGKCKPVLRMGSSSNNQNDGDNIAVTDNGNYIVDLVFDKPIEDAPAAAAQLKNTCGVVDHGFFIGMTTAVIIAGEAGISVKTP